MSAASPQTARVLRGLEKASLLGRDGQIRTHGLRAAKRIAIDHVVSRAVEEAENRAAEENTPFTAEDADRIGTEIRERLAAGDLERPWKMALVLAQEHTITDARAAEIERLIDQHGANFLRFAMTEADHMRFVQGLLDLGVEPEKVGKKLRLKDKDAAVLVTVAQNTTAAGLAQQGVLGLSDGAVLAELLAEFEAYGDETEAVAALTETAQTNPDQLARVAQRLRNARTERLALEAAAAELAEQGVTVIDRPDTLTGPQIRQLADLRYTVRTKPGTALTVKRHAKCPGHAAFLTFHRTWQDKEGKVRIIHVCTDFQKHKHAELRAERGKVFVERSTYSSSGGPKKGPMTEEEKKYRKTVIANGKAWESDSDQLINSPTKIVHGQQGGRVGCGFLQRRVTAG